MSMTDYDGEYGTARALGRPVRIVATHDLPPHVRRLAEAVQEWAAIEVNHALDGPHPVCINTAAGLVRVGQSASDRKLARVRTPGADEQLFVVAKLHPTRAEFYGWPVNADGMPSGAAAWVDSECFIAEVR